MVTVEAVRVLRVDNRPVSHGWLETRENAEVQLRGKDERLG